MRSLRAFKAIPDAMANCGRILRPLQVYSFYRYPINVSNMNGRGGLLLSRT
jgi:hypothetical protein